MFTRGCCRPVFGTPPHYAAIPLCVIQIESEYASSPSPFSLRATHYYNTVLSCHPYIIETLPSFHFNTMPIK